MATAPGLLEAFRSESAALVTLAATSDPQLPIPACEGLTVGDLVGHVGTIYRLVGDWIAQGRRPDRNPVPPTSSLEWTADGAERLYRRLSELDPAAACATWCAGDRTVGFWIRRMAHETAVHRVDLAQAAGTPWTIDDVLADDGLDEAMELWLGTQLGAAVNGSGRAVRIGDRWTVRLLATLVDFPGLSGTVDAAIDGDPAALWAWAWGRGDEAHPTHVVGSVDAAAEVRAALARTQQ